MLKGYSIEHATEFCSLLFYVHESLLSVYCTIQWSSFISKLSWPKNEEKKNPTTWLGPCMCARSCGCMFVCCKDVSTKVQRFFLHAHRHKYESNHSCVAWMNQSSEVRESFWVLLTEAWLKYKYINLKKMLDTHWPCSLRSHSQCFTVFSICSLCFTMHLSSLNKDGTKCPTMRLFCGFNRICQCLSSNETLWNFMSCCFVFLSGV